MALPFLQILERTGDDSVRLTLGDGVPKMRSILVDTLEKNTLVSTVDDFQAKVASLNDSGDPNNEIPLLQSEVSKDNAQIEFLTAVINTANATPVGQISTQWIQ